MRGRIAAIARQRPLAAFFTLTFAFSWGLWLAFQPFYLRGDAWAGPLLMLGIFGPALAAVALSAIAEPGKRQGKRTVSAAAFALAWLGGALLFTLDQVLGEGRELSPAVVAFGAAAALLPAFVLSQSLRSWPGVRRRLAAIAEPRGGGRHYLLALLLFPFLWGCGLLLTRALGMPLPRIGAPRPGDLLQAFLYTLLFTGLSEEPGWRGFALPLLQERLSPLASSLVLGAFWALWHAPPRFGGFEARPVADTLVEFALIVLLSILFTWLFNRSGGGILATMLLHASMNIATRFMAVTMAGLLLLAALLAFIIIRDRMWERRGLAKDDQPQRQAGSVPGFF